MVKTPGIPDDQTISNEANPPMPNDDGGKKFTLNVKSWERRSQFLVVLGVAVIGMVTAGLSLASTPSLTKIWSTSADWNAGTLNNVTVANNSVVLASDRLIPSTTAAVGHSQTATNIALKKPTTCSSIESRKYACRLAVDGNQYTRWSSKWKDPQSITVDLGKAYDVASVKLTWETAYAKAYSIQTSNDAKSWTTIYSTTNGTGGVNNLTSLKGNGRYIRMLGTKRGTEFGYSLHEMAVYGAPAVAGSGGGATYVSSGTETLSFDATNTAQWNSITPVDNKPSGTAISYQYRTSANNSTWSNWADISAIAQAPKTRYLQIMATLTTTSSSVTPTLSKITLNYSSQASAPAVSLTAEPTTITSGQASTLSWTSQNATSCSASNGWTGSKPTSGSVSTGALTQTTAFSISCTGDGGTATSNVTVTVNPVTTGGGGGGGTSGAYSCVTASLGGHCEFPDYAKITNTLTDPNPYVDQNVWSGGGGYKSTLYANSPSDWYISVSNNTHFGGVQSFSNGGFHMSGKIDSYKSITSSWDVTIPTDTSKVAGWAAYDLWFNNNDDEVMIQTDLTANEDYDCDAAATATFNGMPWHMCAFDTERVWKPGIDDAHMQNQKVGSLDILAILKYMENTSSLPDKLPAGSTWTTDWGSGSFGFEICDTEGTTQTFRVNDFTWHAQ